MLLRLALIAVVLLSLAGCRSRIISQVRARASFELNCPEDQVAVADFGNQLGAKGCGRAMKCSDVPFAGLLCQEAPAAAEPVRDAADAGTAAPASL
ncbi:MAG: hypothetical protein JNK82_22045 [Myxococcaceae bacterium]|nr:hypothetical protein [Myxococcaceae bacterium]